MTAVTYSAKRSLIGGHTENAEYSLNIFCTELTPDRTVSKEVPESIGGQRETLVFFGARIYDVSLKPMTGAELDAVIEFLDSVMHGEPFTFDPYGTANVPHAPVSAELDISNYSLPRSSRRGQGGANDWHTVTFRVRVLL